MKVKRNNSALLSALAVFKSKDQGRKKKELRKKKVRLNLSTLSQVKDDTSENEAKPEIINGDPSTSQAELSFPVTSRPKRKFVVPCMPCGNVEADKCFSWLIHPVEPSVFYSENWEKKPLYINSRGKNYYKGIFSCADFDKMLRTNHLEYSVNIDVVSYANGKRLTHNPDGRAYAAVVWDSYQNGHSVRLLNPQTYSKPVWKLCSLLQEYFGSFTGANMYLTPPGSQGFAPHYDDIEAFVLQIEGRKMWEVFSPRKPSEMLPRFSSRNFSRDEIGEPILSVELEPGDLLYFPRGFIHQARTPDSTHSLHLTVSTYQLNTWGDLLKRALPQALECAMNENVLYRESLPKDYMNYVGLVNTSNECPERDAFMKKAISLVQDLHKYLSVDAGADCMAKEFIHSSLPPCLTEQERSCSISSSGERWENNGVCNSVELKPDSEIRFIRKRCVRLVREDNKLRLYHSLENSRIYKEREAQYVEIEWGFCDAIEMLLENYPNYVSVESLPLTHLTEQMDIASLLYDKCLIETKTPLQEEDNGVDE